MGKEQLNAAQQSMIKWLSHENELGKAPARIECTKEFELYGLHYYVFRFKAEPLDKWLLAVCGGYEENGLEHSGHIFSDMKSYNDKTAVEDATEIVERIRAYWMKRARRQQQLNDMIKANTDFRTQQEIPVKDIENQFVKTENRFYLAVGSVDFPTGSVIVADPLAYLPSRQFSPVLNKKVPAGERCSVEVSLCRNDVIGLRMCTARLVIKQTPAVKYIKASATEDTVIKLKDGSIEGFPVDAGMICFCDKQTAEEYREFLDRWYAENPDGNHYDDYFAALFAESYSNMPAYQREGGDFIEWINPDTNSRMVMIASGLGDGLYNAYYGYDADDNICQIIVPMVNPDIFDV